MKRYAIVIERCTNNLSAYVPGLPGCIATGATMEEVEQNMREAIAFHLEGMREGGDSVPEPQTAVAYVWNFRLLLTNTPTPCGKMEVPEFFIGQSTTRKVKAR